MASNSTVVKGHPDGISHDYVVLIGVASPMMLLASIVVTLRFYLQKRNLGIWWDDWASLAALVLCLGLIPATVICATVSHAGYHISTYTIKELVVFIKMAIVTEVLYSSSVAMSKFSVLFLYRRLFSVAPRTKFYINIMCLLVAGYALTCILGIILGYLPLYNNWQPGTPYTTIQTRAFFVTMAVINTTLDIAILSFPQTKVWKLQISKKERLLVSLVFLMGGFCCISSLVRLYYLATYNTADSTYDLTNSYIWTLIEPTTSIICASLPIIYKLSKRKDAAGSSTGASSGYSGKTSKQRRDWKDHSTSSGDSSVPSATTRHVTEFESHGGGMGDPRSYYRMDSLEQLDTHRSLRAAEQY